MSQIHPNKCLPPELTIESVDDILYRIGLCFTSVRVRPKRHFINHPSIVFIVTSIVMIANIITALVSEEKKQIIIALGNVGHFIGIRQLYSILLSLASMITLLSQLCYYYNYRNGIKPSFLRVFQMMSGRVPPIRLGLTNEIEIKRLLRITAKLNNLFQISNFYFLPLFCFVYELSFYLFYGTPL